MRKTGVSPVGGKRLGTGETPVFQRLLWQTEPLPIFLPAAQTAAAHTHPSLATTPEANGELVLVVDDETPIRSLAESILQKQGYRTLSAADGAEAATIYMLYAEKIRAVLTALIMPVWDGVTLCRTIRSTPSEIPIIASSGNSDQVQTKELQTLSANRVLGKPYKPAELVAALHEALCL